MTSRDLAVFLQKYPEPSAFEQAVKGFLDKIEQANFPQKRREYEASLREFMSIVYGKRYEYYNQMKLLRTRADVKYPELARERARRETFLTIVRETDIRNIEQLLKNEFLNIIF